MPALPLKKKLLVGMMLTRVGCGAVRARTCVIHPSSSRGRALHCDLGNDWGVQALMENRDHRVCVMIRDLEPRTATNFQGPFINYSSY